MTNIIYNSFKKNIMNGAIDFGADKSSSAGNFIITWNAEGIVNLG